MAGLIVAAGTAVPGNAPTPSGNCDGGYRLVDTDTSMFGSGKEDRYTIQCTCNNRYFTVTCGNQFDASVPRSRCAMKELLAPYVPDGVTDMATVSSIVCGGKY